VSATTIDEAAKQRVAQALRAQTQADLRAAQASVAAERSAAEIDQDDSFSDDDLSQSDDEGGFVAEFEGIGEQEDTTLARIDALDFGPATLVAPGAIVAFDGDRYVVGVATEAFECDGNSYQGIATDAPVYEAIAGKRSGDTFTFRGREHRIDFVA
jgi:hypothetical protein